TIEQLGIPNWKSWAFGHTVVELCTAVKGPAALYFARTPGVEKILYLDPDTKVFNHLAPLSELLDAHEILLTPHLLEPESRTEAILDNEVSALKHGVFNLGFFAARTSGQGLAFLEWWAQRLLRFCIDDIPNGFFTDQRWCDLAPCFFDRLHIIRDPGYNVATWNVAHRPITKRQDGTYFAGNTPLRFYHFTGYDSGAGMGMLLKYAETQAGARELWENYASDLRHMGHGAAEYRLWRYGTYSNGVPVELEARRRYRFRQDLQSAFPDPYLTERVSFLAWWCTERNAPQSTSQAASRRLRNWLVGVLPQRLAIALRAAKRRLVSGRVSQ
ncbi:MAG: hypothetical protein OEV08_04145, partial [Nitrospira sp.]|nr:hypothetical protein [Nitrospira sp.]